MNFNVNFFVILVLVHNDIWRCFAVPTQLLEPSLRNHWDRRKADHFSGEVKGYRNRISYNKEFQHLAESHVYFLGLFFRPDLAKSWRIQVELNKKKHFAFCSFSNFSYSSWVNRYLVFCSMEYKRVEVIDHSCSKK